LGLVDGEVGQGHALQHGAEGYDVEPLGATYRKSSDPSAKALRISLTSSNGVAEVSEAARTPERVDLVVQEGDQGERTTQVPGRRRAGTW
jgi:hypothetical protein